MLQVCWPDPDKDCQDNEEYNDEAGKEDRGQHYTEPVHLLILATRHCVHTHTHTFVHGSGLSTAVENNNQ